MEKIAGVSGAFVNNNISLHFADEVALDEEMVASAIKEFGIKVKSSKKVEALPF